MPHSFNVSAFGPDPGRSDFSILTPFGRNRNSRFPVSAELRRQTAPVHVILAAISVPINLNSNGSIRTATKGGCARAVQTEVARRMMIDPSMVQVAVAIGFFQWCGWQRNLGVSDWSLPDSCRSGGRVPKGRSERNGPSVVTAVRPPGKLCRP